MKQGDLVWQTRIPGGVCIFIEEVTIETSERNPPYWSEDDEPMYRILHPVEGVIEDPSYYYMTLEEEMLYNKQQVYEATAC